MTPPPSTPHAHGGFWRVTRALPHLVDGHVAVGRDRAIVLLAGQQQLQGGLDCAKGGDVHPGVRRRPRHRIPEAVQAVQAVVLPQRQQRGVQMEVCERPADAVPRFAAV